MRKSLLITSTIAVLCALIGITLLGSTTGLELIVGADPFHNVVRVVLIAALLVLAYTVRPRAMALRYSLGTVSAVITAVALVQMANYQLPLLDALTYLIAATVLMVEALEDAVFTEPATELKKLGTA